MISGMEGGRRPNPPSFRCENLRHISKTQKAKVAAVRIYVNGERTRELPDLDDLLAGAGTELAIYTKFIQ